MLSSEVTKLSDGQAKVSETLAVLTPIREESQWLREESQQLHQQVNKLGQQLNARISTVEQQVGTLQDAVAQQRDDLFGAVEFVAVTRQGRAGTCLGSRVGGEALGCGSCARVSNEDCGSTSGRGCSESM